MEASAATPGPAGSAAPGEPETLLQTVAALWRELPGLLSDRIELASLEIQRAGAALLQIVVLLVVGAILGVTAWLVLWAGIVALLLASGMPLWAALAVLLLCNAGAAWFVVFRVRALLPRLNLSATRRHLMLGSPPLRADDDDPPHPHAPHDADHAHGRQPVTH